MLRNENLCSDAHLNSQNGLYKLLMQTDGNLVLYNSGNVIWALNTYGFITSSAGLHFDQNGNLAIFSQDGQLIWSFNFQGKEAAFLKVQDDGCVVVIGNSGELLWFRRSGLPNANCGSCISGRDTLMRGEYLCSNHHLMSQNGKYTLNMQSDGNLVLKESNRPTWYTNTQGFILFGKGLQFGVDGNLFIYDNEGEVQWSSEFQGKDAAYLKIRDDGCLVVYGNSGDLIWYRNSFALPDTNCEE